MSEEFIEVYAKSTGVKQMIPVDWLDHPVLGCDFEVTPSGREEQRVADGPSLDWTFKQLEDHADGLGVDHTGLRSKKAVLEVIEAHVPQTPTDSTGVTETPLGDVDGTPPNPEPTATVAEQE